MERLQTLRDEVATRACGKTIESVEVGVVTNDLAESRKEVLMGGEQESLTLHFSDGTSLRLETRSGFKDEGSFFVVRD